MSSQNSTINKHYFLLIIKASFTFNGNPEIMFLWVLFITIPVTMLDKLADKVLVVSSLSASQCTVARATIHLQFDISANAFEIRAVQSPSV
jgi:uncharacterized membrane protein YgaE (UPF0421/DUF939 family)